MAKKNSSIPLQGCLFEEDFLLRTLGPIVRSADVALTELVANAWDAGASVVKINIPDEYDDLLVIEDDGVGMTPSQFHEKWMTLGYDRVKHQGSWAEFPQDRLLSKLSELRFRLLFSTHLRSPY